MREPPVTELRGVRALAVEDARGAAGGRNVFALRVRGAAMADEGLRDGDCLLVEVREAAAGQTVVVEVDGRVTVKRLCREADGRLRLQAAGAGLLPFALPAANVRILGVVIGVVRRGGSRTATPRPLRAGTASPLDDRSLDLELRAIAQALGAAEARAAGGATTPRLRELARDLRTLRDCYLETSTPRLRAALLREARGVLGRLVEACL